MLKTVLSVFALSAAIAPAAMADVPVAVGQGNGWHGHQARHRLADATRRHGPEAIYYSGAYASVSRDNGATIIHAYPGVDVYVGGEGGVNVSVGY